MSAPPETSFDPYHLWLQVPKDVRPPTYYQMLGLAYGEKNPEVIRQATLMRSAYVRHFQNGPNAADATRILEELSEACRVLQDPAERAAYEAKVKPASKSAPAAKPPGVANAKPMVVQPPKAPVADYDLASKAERRPKKKSRKSRSNRSVVNGVFAIVVLGAALGVTAYLISVYNRSQSPVAKADEKGKTEKQDASSQSEKLVPKYDPGAQANSQAPAARPPDALLVRLSVDPSDARLTLEPIGDSKPGGPKANLEGEGAERTIVAEKGALPLVVAASADGYQSNRVTVFSSDAGRLVVVQLQKDGGGSFGRSPAGGNPSFGAGNQGAGRSGRRTVGAYRTGIPLATKDVKPVWKYAVARPAYDWTTPTFGDVLWKDGEGSFGTKAGKNAVKAPGVWIRSPWASRELWLRTKVDLPPAVKTASIRWTYRSSGPIEVFVNGVEQFSVPSSGMLAATRDTAGGLFQAGENTVAVHASNPSGPGLVDLGFDWIATEEAK